MSEKHHVSVSQHTPTLNCRLFSGRSTVQTILTLGCFLLVALPAAEWRWYHASGVSDGSPSDSHQVIDQSLQQVDHIWYAPSRTNDSVESGLVLLADGGVITAASIRAQQGDQLALQGGDLVEPQTIVLGEAISWLRDAPGIDPCCRFFCHP